MRCKQIAPARHLLALPFLILSLSILGCGSDTEASNARETSVPTAANTSETQADAVTPLVAVSSVTHIHDRLASDSIEVAEGVLQVLSTIEDKASAINALRALGPLAAQAKRIRQDWADQGSVGMSGLKEMQRTHKRELRSLVRKVGKTVAVLVLRAKTKKMRDAAATLKTVVAAVNSIRKDLKAIDR